MGLQVDPDKLVAHISRRTARDVSMTTAMKLALEIMDKAGEIRTTPQQYVLGSISRSWAEVQQQIDAEVA